MIICSKTKKTLKKISNSNFFKRCRYKKNKNNNKITKKFNKMNNNNKI